MYIRCGKKKRDEKMKRGRGCVYVVSLFLATFFVWFLREGEFLGETGWVGKG